MTSLIYIHGFLSSPQSYKAQATARWLRAHRPEIGFFCPHLTPYPRQTQRYLENLVESLQTAGPVVLMGSSLGGYWCTWLAERYGLKAVVINPSVQPWAFMPEFLEVDLTGYHTDDSYRLHVHHVDEIKAVYVDTLTRKDNYWLLVQTGDETLDYREAVARYQGCKQSIEQGGDHGFQNFDRHLPDIIEFLVDRDR